MKVYDVSSEPVRVAMVGLGQWGPNLLRVLRESRDFEVAALCDIDQARLDAFAELHPRALRTTELSEALAADVAAVVIATPANLHVDQVEHCLKLGKDVFVEKPVATSLADARRLTALATRQGRILMAGHTFLFNPAVRRVKQAIHEGLLGKVKYAICQRLSLGRIRDDVNALWNLAPHDISILLYWFGAMPKRVTAQGLVTFDGRRQEDVVFAQLEFPGNVLASVNVSWLAPTKVRDMVVVGSERMVRYDDVSKSAPLTLYHRGAEEVPSTRPDGTVDGFHLAIRQGGEERLQVDAAEPLALAVAHFRACVESRDEPFGSGNELLRVTSVLEALDRSLKSGGEPRTPEAP
ncbi:MAG: Gfo/Idh/MocA family oxidoreductase [Candidatus Sumerlaeia bacterium]|nr:Gfo/Idh/MocA family oxidoreductase [Candidatus Sumerlaeia bacterium]